MPQLTEKETKDLTASFKMFDKNGDGSISCSELKTVMRSVGQNVTDAEAAEMIKSMDRSGNGKIEFREFLDGIANSKRGMKTQKEEEQEILEAFKIIDRDGNGFISAPELRQIVTCMGERMTEEEADAMICTADLNGDGRINYKEFASILTRKP